MFFSDYAAFILKSERTDAELTGFIDRLHKIAARKRYDAWFWQKKFKKLSR